MNNNEESTATETVSVGAHCKTKLYFKVKTALSVSKESGDQENLLEVYDPPMCCSSGVCGPNIDPNLMKFASLLKTLSDNNIKVERYNLSQQPQAFTENKKVLEMLTAEGESMLPYIFINGDLLCKGRYPSKEELFMIFGLNSQIKTSQTEGNSCCSSGGCC